MINSDRIVPITKTDLLSLYAVMLAMTDTEFAVAESNTVDGDYDEAAVTKAMLCNQPLKTFNFGTNVTSATIYFVPALNYEGFTKGGSALTATGDVDADGATLYKAALASGTVTITKVGA